MKDVMVDLETLGTRAGCVILSIGACAFRVGAVDEANAFYEVVDERSCLVAGLKVEAETEAWWAGQSPEAQAVLTYARDPGASAKLADVLNDFSRYLSTFGPDVRVWGNGADFDNPILVAAYAAVGLKQPWKPYNGRCHRTLKNLFPEVGVDRAGLTHHNALDDAIAQARQAAECLRRFEEMKTAKARGVVQVDGDRDADPHLAHHPV